MLEVTLRDLVREAVREALDGRIDADAKIPAEKLAFREKNAAELIDIPVHSLRDCRRRGEIIGTRVGGRILYRREDLVEFLQRQRMEDNR
ncbi:helix-turn-helix domain-containing protein [Symmachiella dynata]|uniref:helix-turn-helix domain-containing protein n=1 Tax=Symmachiella dynata TaxID=2527995 RepID=UPI0030ED2B1F|tara:strand:- start:1176 stop:1445 length:270 start_codon:yes stop_codon:yes gene_type:complete